LSRLRNSLLALAVLATVVVAAQPAYASGNSISVDAAAPTGVVQPSVTGQMMEWASDDMNGAWAQRVDDRSMETDTVSQQRSSLYDSFTGTALDRSKWTPMSLDTAPAGTVAVSGSQVAVTAASGGRFGIMSNNIPNTRYANVSVETRVVSYTGTNAILDLGGGNGAGDFTHFVEFAIEGGALKAFADGQPIWTGGAATTPAVLRIDASALSGTARTLNFFYNGTLVHTLTNFTLLPENFRAFLYGFSGTATFDYLTVNPDATYDSFAGTSLSPRWTPTSLVGGAGSVSVTGGTATVTGAASARYGVLSDYIRDSATNWTTIDARLTAATGTNALLDIYGGAGAGDFSKFMEFGVEGGVAKVFTSDGTGNWTGSAVSLPATLSVQVSPWWSNGRLFRFSINGSVVYELATRFDVPAPDYRVFLYGFGTGSTSWDYVNVTQVHLWDRWDTSFEGGGLSGAWTPTTLVGGWGSASQANSEVTIQGAASSRYGIISAPIDESDLYGYTLQAKLDSYTGTNALMDLYAGTGRGDFTKFIEFGLEAGTLRVYGDGVPSWTGPAMSAPVVLRIEVGPWTPSGRNIYFYANGQLEYTLESNTVIGNKNYQAFLYGYGTSVTKWDYLTWWRSEAPWNADGYTDRATYSQERTAFNGTYSERVDNVAHTTGRVGLAQGSIDVVGGHQYQVSVYLKQTGLTTPITVSLGPDVGDGPSYPAYGSTTFSGVTGSWAKYTATITPTTTDQQAKLFVGTASAGTFWVDMASVMPLDPSEVADGGWRKDFVDRVAALKPGAIRWPGGIIADSYNWQDGVGASDNRPPQYYGQWDAEIMNNDVGTDEVLGLAQQLGIPVLLNVNWGTGTSANAANWVEYANGSTGTTYGAQRAANGHVAPWAVHDWEIGNEVWGSWTAGHATAASYATSYNTFHTAMAAKDASVAFVAEGGDGTVNDQVWNGTVLSTSAPGIDELSLHYYSPQGLPQNYDSAGLYLASVGAPVTISGRLDSTVNTILANTTRDIKIAVTEHNAMYFNDENRRTRSLEGGLQEAGLLNMFIRRPEATDLNTASALANFWDGSSIRLGNRGSFVTPGYLMQALLANNHGPLVLNSNVSTGTYNAAAFGNLAAKTGIPLLDVTTTRSMDGTKLYVSVINRDASSSQPTTINLSNAGTISSTATASTVTSANYLDANSWLNPNLIQTATSAVTGVGSSFSYTFPAHSYTVLTINTTATAITGPMLIGQVTNSAGTPIAGATVTTNTGLFGTTDSAGYYRFAVPVGTYSLTTTAAGHPNYTRTAVEVTTLGATPLPIRLS
jgi:alpha-L-arabinofuranosidase